MALTERNRNALYQGFVSLIDDEEAVEAMLSYFPARDVEEPVTKEYLRAEVAVLRTELRDEMAELRTELHVEMAGMRTDMERVARNVQTWMIGTAVSLGGLVIAVGAIFR